MLRRPQDKKGNEIPEQYCDQDVEQNRRNLFMILRDEIFPVFNDFLVGRPVATLIRDRSKSQQSWENQSTKKEPFQYRGKMLTRRSISHSGEGAPQIEIHKDARYYRQGSAREIRND